jgi:RNase H-fold protein (predicted Holliday junction resolvase)
MITAIDPGREKCGVAVATLEQEIVTQEIVPTFKLKARLETLQTKYNSSQLVVGNGTNSEFITQEVGSLFSEIKVIDEANSTLEARDYYWERNPPTGFWKLVPRSLLYPPEPFDDYVAVILLKRYANQLT